MEAFLEEGCNVAYCARAINSEDFGAAGVNKGRVKGTKLDVQDSAALKSWVEDTVQTFQGVDIFVNSGTWLD